MTAVLFCKKNYLDLARVIRMNNEIKGWNVLNKPEYQSLPEKVEAIGALICSEIIEALQEFRKRDLKTKDEIKAIFAEELADIEIRILDCVGAFDNPEYIETFTRGIDIGLKDWQYLNVHVDDFFTSNYKVPSLIAKLIVQVGEAISSIALRTPLLFIQALGDLYAKVELLARYFHIDIERAIYVKIEKNKQRERKHGGKIL